jgi:hypothetical protein
MGPLVTGPEHPRPELSGWQVHISAVPVAILAADGEWPQRDRDLLHDLAGGLAYGFDAIRTTWEAAHVGLAVVGYRLALKAADADTAPLSLVDVRLDDGVAELTVSVNANAFAELADADINASQAAMADLVSQAAQQIGVASEAVESLRRGWVEAMPTLAVRIVEARTSRPELSSPLEIDEAFTSEAHREIARRVRSSEVHAGTYSGDAAKALDRDVLAPTALNLLSERLARHDVEELLAFAMLQAERTVAARERDVRNIEQSARTMTLDWDPVAKLAEVQAKSLLLRRCIEVLVELALRDQPGGDRPLDRLAWVELLSAAHTYLEATSRSEAVHHQVRPTAIEISDMYEIAAVDPPSNASAETSAGAGQVYALDLEAFQRARTIHAMDRPDSSSQAVDLEPGEPVAPRERVENLPGISTDVDRAMKEVFGASASDIITVLFALGRWPLEPTDPDAVVTSVTAILETLNGLLAFREEPDGERRIESAVNLLMSRPDELRSADWRPWHARSRQRRLLVQPLAALRDDFVVVGPHFCLGSASVYINYLTQGMLPWSTPQPPWPLDRALADHRDARNRQLEDDVGEALREAGYACEVRIHESDPKRLGVPSISGEIDAVAGRAGSPTLWLLEVKDPADVFVVPEIRRHLDRFYVTRGKDKAYVEQLAAKYNDLRPHADNIAAAIGLPVGDGMSYEVRPMFVTRRPVPAAFVGGPFPFTTLPELADALVTQ